MKGFSKLLIGFITSALVFASCSTTRYYSGVPLSSVYPVALIQPSACIYYIDSHNTEFISDSLSNCTEAMLSEILKTSKIPIAAELKRDDYSRPADLYSDIMYLTRMPAKSMSFMQVPENICNYLLENGYRYGVVVSSNGFVREKKSAVKQAAAGMVLGIATAILTGGAVSVYGTTSFYNTQVNLAVVDAEQNCVIYSDFTNPSESNPQNERVLRNHLEKILDHYTF